MANTTNGIYYPNDYNAAADVLADMKQMAESIDVKFGDVENNEAEIKQDISKIKAEQETQNEDISSIKEKDTNQDKLIVELQTQVIDLETENENIKNQIPTGEESGENITLKDSAEMEFKELRIGGNSWQETRSGKNLFDKTQNFNKTNTSVDDWTITQLDTGVRILSQYVEGSPNIKYHLLDLTNYVGKTVRAKSDFVGSANNQGKIILGICDKESSNSTKYAETTVSGETISFVVPELEEGKTLLYVILYANYNGTQTSGNYVDYTNLIITIDNEDMTYEPYGAMPSPEFRSEIRNVGENGSANITVCNENLLDYTKIKEDLTNVSKDNTFSLIPNGIRMDTKFTASGYPFSRYIWCKADDFVGQQLTISLNSKSSNTNAFSIRLSSCNAVGSNSKIIALSKAVVNKDLSLTATIPEDAKGKYLALDFSPSYYTEQTGPVYVELTNISVKLGSVVPEKYIPHQSQQITFPLSEGQRMPIRSFLTDNGIKHNRGQVVLTGNENWSFTTLGSGYLQFYCVVEKIKHSATEVTIICNQFKGAIINDRDNPENDNISFTWTNGVAFIKNDFTTLEEWKTYLAEQYANGTPVTVEYELAEEVIEPYTEEQQKVYNEINKAHSYKNVTHIFSTDEIKPINKVIYRKDLETHINNEIDKKTNALTNAILELGGTVNV